jgi:hypothetical protein
LKDVSKQGLDFIAGPSDTFSVEREGLLAVLSCTIGSDGAIYIATPITGGLRFLEWYENEGRQLERHPEYEVERRAKVIVPNCEDGAAFAEALRNASGKVVIDPSRFFLRRPMRAYPYSRGSTSLSAQSSG